MYSINKIPKVDLHLHLDGSLDVKKIKEKYKMTDEDITDKFIADDKCNNLNDYLKKFDYPLSILQTKEELKNAMIDLLNNLKEENVIYAEIRFAPQLHTRKGLTQEEVVKTIIDTKTEVSLKTNIILCYMRGKDNMKQNLETLEVAKKYINKGVCAVDLAGAEALYKTELYKDLFEKTKEYKIPFTIHAGEADGPESIKCAISFGAKRIGHGVRCIEDEETMKMILENDITLEVCPTSNIQTKIYNNYKQHPLENLYKKGIKVTINTDNMTVSNTNLINEYNQIINNTNLNEEDIINMNINSINSAFISKLEKAELIDIIKKYELEEK